MRGTMTYKDLTILFEDNHVLVAVKPIGVPAQSDKTGSPDMLSMLKEYLIEKYNKPGDAYLGLVHRLDRMTGGVMVFAKTSKAAERLCEAIRQNEVEKKYLAVLDGVPRFKRDKLTCYLKKYASTNTVKVVPELTEGAKYAELDYKVLDDKDNKALVAVKLVTGRTHQIRVQMADMGTPISGDRKYGFGKMQDYPLALWATELKFVHPISGQNMVFRVYPPETQPWLRFNVEQFLGYNSTII